MLLGRSRTRDIALLGLEAAGFFFIPALNPDLLPELILDNLENVLLGELQDGEEIPDGFVLRPGAPEQVLEQAALLRGGKSRITLCKLCF